MRRLVRRRRGMPSVRRPLPAGVAGAAAVVVVGAGALAGCDSSATPTGSVSATATSSSPSGSPSPSASASPSGSPTVEIPAAAREKTDKGAEAFVRYFFDQVNEAWTTPRAGVISTLSDSGCQFCRKSESDAASLVNTRQRYASAPITVTTVKTMVGAAPKGQVFVRTGATQNKVDVVDAENWVVRRDSRKALRLTTGLIWKGGQWYVYEVEVA